MATATFVGTDTVTQGSWLGVYGAAGYYKLYGGTSGQTGSTPVEQSLPTGLTVTDPSANGSGTNFTFVSNSTNAYALQRADGSARDEDGWFSAGSETLSITPSDSLLRRLRVYCLDLSNAGRTQTVDVRDHATGVVLDSRSVSSFGAGIWLSWDVTGAVDVVATNTAPGLNANVSGLFWDTPTGGAQSLAPAAVAAQPTPGALTLTPGPVALALGAVAPVATPGALTLQPGPVAVALAGLGAQATPGSITLVAAGGLSLPAIAGAPSVGSITLAAGTATIALPAIAAGPVPGAIALIVAGAFDAFATLDATQTTSLPSGTDPADPFAALSECTTVRIIRS